MERKIRLAETKDLEEIMTIYDNARKFMAANGNPTQWANHPTRDLIVTDIAAHRLYVLVDDLNVILGVFAFIEGPDSTYSKIYDGKWLNDRPYWVIHRLASNLKAHGVFKAISDWCLTKATDIRIDTHRDNIPMQKALYKYGYSYCGVIHLDNGDPRIAFQFCKKV